MLARKEVVFICRYVELRKMSTEQRAEIYNDKKLINQRRNACSCIWGWWSIGIYTWKSIEELHWHSPWEN